MATLKRKSPGLDFFDTINGDSDNGSDSDDNVPKNAGKPTIELKMSSKTGDEVTLKKKEGKKRVKIDTDRLRGVDGLRRVYEEFPVICEFKGRGSEVRKLTTLGIEH